MNQLAWISTGALPPTLTGTLQSTWGRDWDVRGVQVVGVDANLLGRDIPAPTTVITRTLFVDDWYAPTADYRFLLLEIGAGDLFFGADPRTCYTSIAAYCLSRRTHGWIVVLTTLFPRDDWADSDESARTIYEQHRVAVNALLLASPPADAILDLRMLQDPARHFLPKTGTLNVDGVYYACQSLRETVAELMRSRLQIGRGAGRYRR